MSRKPKALLSLFLALCMALLLVTPAIAEDEEVDPAPALEAQSESILTAENFPDSNFLAALKEAYPDGITAEEAETDVTTISVLNKNISDLTGIELFPALQYLFCGFNTLERLDISQNPELISVDCGVNQIVDLNATGNPKLLSLVCHNNRLTTLNVSALSALRELNCFRNELTALDLSANIELRNLICRENHLFSLDISNNIYLCGEDTTYFYISTQTVDVGSVGETFDLKDYAPDADSARITDVSGAEVAGTVFSNYKNGVPVSYFYVVDPAPEPMYVEVHFSRAEDVPEEVPPPEEIIVPPPTDEGGTADTGDEEATDTEEVTDAEEETPAPDEDDNKPSDNEERPAPDFDTGPDSSGDDDNGADTPSFPVYDSIPPVIIIRPDDTEAEEEAKDETDDAPTEKEEVTIPFSDVPEDSYYCEAVKWAYTNGITSGTSENTFSPAAACTRAQMVTFLWRCAGAPEPEQTDTAFSDIEESAYYYKAVLWARQQGIAYGVGNNLFSPHDVVNRAQMVTMLWRMNEQETADGVNPFDDVHEEAYYYRAVLWAGNSGISVGTATGTFSPDMNCNRGQIVTFLYRAFAEYSPLPSRSREGTFLFRRNGKSNFQNSYQDFTFPENWTIIIIESERNENKHGNIVSNCSF